MEISFPVQATHNGKQYMLRTQDYLPLFCKNLQFDQIDLPEWYQELYLPPPINNPPSTPRPSAA